jgi:SAM-dependent methyltransferase
VETVVLDRIKREQEFFDELVVEGSTTGSLLDRFSKAFYEKGTAGRLWSPVWQTINLKGSVVLDYGCGVGDFSLLLARHGARVYGIDISSKLIEQARASVEGSGLNGCAPEFLVGDAHRAPFEDSSFDYVFGNGALHHLDLSKACAEIARLLKPGGKAVFQEPMYYHPLLWTLRRLTPKTHTADERPLSLADFEQMRKGFSVCTHREHFLFAVFAAPAHLLGRRFAQSVIGGIDRFDGIVMRAIPALRRFAWLTVLEMKK